MLQLSKYGLRRAAVGMVALFALSSAAQAVDGDDAAARLRTLFGEQGGSIEYTAVQTNGSTVVIRDAKISIDDESRVIGTSDITLNDVSGDERDGFKIGDLTLPKLEIEIDARTHHRMVLIGLRFERITLPPKEAAGPFAKILQWEKLTIRQISSRIESQEIYVADNLSFAGSAMSATSPGKYSFNVDSLKLNLGSVASPIGPALKDLGYETITGKIAVSGGWDLANGHITIDKAELIADDVATLSLALDATGYTLDVFEALEHADAINATEVERRAIMDRRVMPRLKLAAAFIRFDDNSLTNKVLDYIARQQGGGRSDVINQAKATLLAMVATSISDTDFIKSLTEALDTYLNDPRSIELRLGPEKPTSLSFIRLGMIVPNTLIKTLRIRARANE